MPGYILQRKPVREQKHFIHIVKGDVCETLGPVTLRAEESLESEIVLELPLGATLEILQVGADDRRVKVACGCLGAVTTAWCSARTAENDPLLQRRPENVNTLVCDLRVGSELEVKSPVTVRKGEGVDTAMVTELKPRTKVRILQLGVTNNRRARIQHGRIEGWISLATRRGEHLVGPVITKDGNGKSNGHHHHHRHKHLFGASTAKVKAMLEASRAGDAKTLRKICDGGHHGILSMFSRRPDLNHGDIRGKTALMYAAGSGRLEIVDFLLEKHEVDIDAQDDTRKTALHHAAKRARRDRENDHPDCQADVAKALVTHRAHLEGRDHNGCTALMFAAANDDARLVSVLLEARANANVGDYEGSTSLDYATKFGRNDLVHLLRAHGAMVGHQEEEVEDCSEWVSEGASSGSAVSREEVPSPGKPKVATISAKKKPKAAPKDKKCFRKGPSAAMEGEDATNNATSSATAEEEQAAPPRDPVPVATSAVAPTAAPVKRKGPGRSKSANVEVARVPSAKVLEEPCGDEKGRKKKSDAKEKGDKGKSPKASAKKDAEEEEEEEKPTERPSLSMRRRSSTAMAEMHLEIAVAEARTGTAETDEIKVEDQPPEVDPKVAALENLAAIVGSATLATEVEGAIAVAQAAGADDGDLQEAQARAKELKARATALDMLKIAIKALEVKGLHEAIAAAERSGVPQGEIHRAKAVLAVEEPKERAREGLQAAQTAGSTGCLQQAIAEAQKVGLAPAELAPFEELFRGAESREQAEAALNAAIETRDCDKLKFAIQEGKNAKVDAKLLATADAVFAEEVPKQKAREVLKAAVAADTIEALKVAIEEAKAAGLKREEIAEAETNLKRKEDQVRLLAEVKQVSTEVKGTVDMSCIDAISEAKKKLSDSIVAAKEVGVTECLLGEFELQRRKLHNAIEDLKGSIRVFCRVRPLSGKEREQGDIDITNFVDGMTVGITTANEKEPAIFQFDAFFKPGKQEEVFEDCRDLVQSAVDGYNVTLFAYGQTGAGKTYTMGGTLDNPGVSRRTIDELYRVTAEGAIRYTYCIMGSMIELYRQDLVDLLQVAAQGRDKVKKLKVRTDKSNCVILEGLTETECPTADSLSDLLETGMAARKVMSTSMNAESSRSHLIFLIRIVSVNKETQDKMNGKILIVDLAGSERLKKSQVSDDGQKEAIEINKSLTALGDVIEALTQNRKQIPYRNHTLTQVMQDALGGTAKTLMFVNCSPASSNIDETMMSLKYATRAKKITKPVAPKSSGDQPG